MMIDDEIYGSQVNDVNFSTFSHVALYFREDAGNAIKADNINYRGFKSTWTSTSFNIGAKITSWGSFTADFDNNDGSHTFGFFTDNDDTLDITDSGTFTSSETITSGTIPSIAISSYIAIIDRFDRDASTETPKLHSVTLNWNEGEILDTASAYFNQRYWLSVAVSSDVNNRILVHDKKEEWQKYVGLNADAMTTFNGKLLFSNGSGIFQGETGNTDYGKDITSIYTTPSILLSGANLKSIFQGLFLLTENSDSTLSTVYTIDGTGQEYSLPSKTMNAKSGINHFKLQFPQDQLRQGRSIDFKFTVTGSDEWRILDGTLEYESDVVAQ